MILSAIFIAVADFMLQNRDNYPASPDHIAPLDRIPAIFSAACTAVSTTICTKYRKVRRRAPGDSQDVLPFISSLRLFPATVALSPALYIP